MNLKVDISGIDEVATQMKRLGNDTFTKKVLNAAQRSASKPMLKEAKQRAKAVVDDNEQLSRSIGHITSKSKELPAVFIGARVKGKFRQKDTTGFYGHFFEEGTTERKTKAGKKTGKIIPDPFLKPSYLAKKAITTNNLKGEINKAFERKVAKL